MHMDKAYDGGYYMLKTPLMPTGPFHDHTAIDAANVTDGTVGVVNTLQQTKWRINTRILDVARECWTAGITHLEGFPSPEDTPLPERQPKEKWDSTSDEERSKIKLVFSEIARENNRLQGRREALMRKLLIADRYRDEPTIWFPWFVDWRTRMYPQSQDLNPQSDMVGKSLLMFAEGQELTDDGYYWLLVHAATKFGHDKLSFTDRARWSSEFADEFADSAKEPFDGNKFWMEADDPLGFLAVCLEITDYREHPDGFTSHLPVNMDGSCNGLQLLSLAGRDPVGAVATNCTSDSARHDLYTEVADEVIRLVEPDARAGDRVAAAWLEKISRKTVKRAVMTTPYGVTQRGIRMQLIEDGMATGLGFPAATAAEYLKDKIVGAMASVCEKPKQIMAYFQDCSRTLAEEDYPLSWVTPNGDRVVQRYNNLRPGTVRTLTGRYDLWRADEDMGMDIKKQSLGAAPNVVHSWDASLCQRVVRDLNSVGVTDFAMIHDSFGVHANRVSEMNDSIRRQAYDMFSAPVLDQWTASVQEAAPNATLPPQPELGDFDVSQVLNSEFFFS